MVITEDNSMKNMQFVRKLPIPKEVKELFPLSDNAKKVKEQRDAEIAKVFKGESDKLLMIIGPCSADREESVLDYVNRLADVQKEVADKLIIIPRIYTGKPRTTGAGYKGMMHQPDPDGVPDMYDGIIAVRSLHSKAIEQTGLTCADEMLYPSNYRYLSDLLSYVAVGARSVENQDHRLTASGMDVPCGMKNGTSGDYGVMLNAIMAAQGGHTFIYRGWEVESKGNELAHAILRGGVDKHGICHPNYHYEDLITLYNMYAADEKYKNPAVIIDTNHSNSGKKYYEQTRIANEVLHSMRHNGDIKRFVKGFMIESYIEEGCQKIEDGVYGKSITDPCLGWEDSKKLIYTVASQL